MYSYKLFRFRHFSRVLFGNNFIMSSSVGLVSDCCLCFLFGFVHVCVLQRLLNLLFSCSFSSIIMLIALLGQLHELLRRIVLFYTTMSFDARFFYIRNSGYYPLDPQKISAFRLRIITVVTSAFYHRLLLSLCLSCIHTILYNYLRCDRVLNTFNSWFHHFLNNQRIFKCAGGGGRLVFDYLCSPSLSTLHTHNRTFPALSPRFVAVRTTVLVLHGEFQTTTSIASQTHMQENAEGVILVNYLSSHCLYCTGQSHSQFTDCSFSKQCRLKFLCRFC